MVLMEALALGRPAIATWVAGIPELIEPGVNGWLVPPASVAALADAMREALTAPSEQLERMGREGAARVARQHNAAVNARRLAALFARSERSAERSFSDRLKSPPVNSWKRPAHDPRPTNTSPSRPRREMQTPGGLHGRARRYRRVVPLLARRRRRPEPGPRLPIPASSMRLAANSASRVSCFHRTPSRAR